MEKTGVALPRLSGVFLAASFVLAFMLWAIVRSPTGAISLARLNAPASPRAESYIWPGTLEYETGSRPTALRFVASSRRYTADTMSAGFTLHGSRAGEPFIGVRYSGALSGLEAHPDESKATALTIFGARETHITRTSFTRFLGIYPGVDVHYRVADGDLEFDFVVAPGASPDQIQLEPTKGSRFVRDPGNADILVEQGSLRYRIKRPVAYQEIGGARRPVAVDTNLDGNTLKYRIGKYDRRYELVIDPLVTTFSSFIGTTTDAGYDVVKAMSVDAEGNTYIAGMTGFDLQLNNAAPFYRPSGSLLVPYPGESDNCQNLCGYVVKLNSRHEVVYSALIFWLDIRAIAVDNQNGVYLTGASDAGTRFPWTTSTYDAISNPPTGSFFTPTAFVMKLNPSGTQMDFANLIYGQLGTGIAVDSARNTYVIGTIISGGLVTTPGSLKPDYQDIGPDITNSDSFLLKISPNGRDLVYGTYLGGSQTDDAQAITLSAGGRPVVVGRTESADFVGIPGKPSGFSDGFIMEISDDGSSVLRSRHIGGSEQELIYAIARDGLGGYIVGGVTTSEDFPTTQGVVQSALLGERNGWLQRVTSGFLPVYSTYFGGSGFDGVLAVTSDPSGSAYFAGVGFSYDLLTTETGLQDISTAISTDALVKAGRQYYPRPNEPVREAYFGVLSPDGRALEYGTYLSGYIVAEELSMGNAIVRHADGRVLTAGSTTSRSFPITDGGLRAYFPASPGGFVTEFKESPFYITSTSVLPVLDYEGASYMAQLSATGGTQPYTWSVVGFRLPEGLTLSSTGTISGRWQTVMDGNGAVTNESGAYQFTIKATDANGLVAYKSFFIPPTTASRQTCTSGRCQQRATLHEYMIFPLPIPARSVPPYSVSVTGNVPSSMFQIQNGNLEGYARPAGEYAFQVGVTDSFGKSATIDWTLSVTDPNAVPPSPPTPAPTPTPNPTGGGSSGGGAFEFLVLTGLGALLLHQAKRRRRRTLIRR
ncbi:MAG: putative Ig domain-containing protein [Gammaproteobacteria bacterium]|nr:putative Ig domain-containing protein [Gammaproteobacteria bacterium]